MLLLIGKKDNMYKLSAAKEATLAVAEIVVVEELDTVHWMQLEDVDGTNKLLTRFITTLK